MDAEAARLAELAERILQGDRRAENKLCSLLTPGIRQIVGNRVRDFACVDDLCNKVLEIVIIRRLRRRRLKEPLRLAAYVRRTAEFVAIGHLRKERRRRTEPVDKEALEEIADPNQDPVATAEIDILMALVQIVLQQLPPRDRRVLEMYYLEGKDRATICRELGISKTYLKVVLWRARGKLKGLL